MDSTSFSKKQTNKIPDSPGVYKFFNKDNELIYVGKAKSLRKRVQSYFNKTSAPNRKTLRMAYETESIEITIVNSEFDALHLENSLIKKNQPRYNIRLKDDKSFPYVCVTSERFPRIISTRRLIPENGTYFGPYTNVKALNNILNLIKSLYTIRTCKYDLSEKNIEAKKFKVCLEYHIKNCKGPCEGLQNENDYNTDIDHSIHILKGNLSMVRDYFKKRMAYYSDNMEYELANKFKHKYDLLKKFQSKSVIVNQKISDIDVFTIVSDVRKAYINYLKIKNGVMVSTKTLEASKKLDETDQDILSLLVVDLREKFSSEAQEIITNISLPSAFDDLNHHVPKIGDKKKLVNLSLKNALFHKREKELKKSDPHENRVLSTLQNDLRLKTLPLHIECFDNSNLQGSYPVASMVCFKKGKPSKKDYRHYNIKTVVGADDFASMKEITYRRYKRLNEEKQELPDLIIVDGGKGQVSAACDALRDLKLYGKIPVLGVAKKLEELYFPEDPYPLHIQKNSESLKLIQRIRDEAHRFAITFHRQKRSKGSLGSKLEKLQGIGEKSMDKLLKKFKSINRIKNAPTQELIALIGEKRAKLLKQKLN
ncbi:MAG: excinuclease ABC subunit UvrC [Bacteroidetes bacterium]|nr:excinuclease ABC subunit UvrC [Bacteroidota bacterium]